MLLVDKKGLNRPEEFQHALKKLGHGAVLVHYLIIDDRVRIILTTQNKQLAYDVEISSAELNRKIMGFRKTLQNPRRPHLAEAQALYEIFITPIDPDLKKAGGRDPAALAGRDSSLSSRVGPSRR